MTTPSLSLSPAESVVAASRRVVPVLGGPRQSFPYPDVAALAARSRAAAELPDAMYDGGPVLLSASADLAREICQNAEPCRPPGFSRWSGSAFGFSVPAVNEPHLSWSTFPTVEVR